MNKEILDFVVEKTNALLAAPSCCGEAKDAAREWLAALGTEIEAAQTAKYIAELEEDIVPIDGFVAFAGSEKCETLFGSQGAADMLRHALAIKAAGAVFCDCAACAACEAILSKKQYML